MNATAKMLLAAAVVAAGLGWLIVDASRPAPDENMLADGREYERVVVVGIDLSGSFLHLMADQGKAWEFLLRVIDRYLRGNGNEKLILVQLSGNTGALIWDGTPSQLRKDFPDQESFRKHLLSKADPNASRLHDGITEALEYLTTLSGITPKTKCALLILSDMDDNCSAPGSEQRLVQALAGFGKRGGAVGMYFVDQPFVNRWRANLKTAGIKHTVVEPSIVASPTLPSFD
jgi:hypothetical protein